MYLFIFIILLISLFIYVSVKKYTIENFNDYSHFLFYYTPITIYDEFYSSIYDKLFKNVKKPEVDIVTIKNITIDNNQDFISSDIKILDLGCGTGNHLKLLKKYNINCVGVDNSLNMLERARNKTNCKLIKADFNKRSVFNKDSFTHILCLYNTIYYVKDLNIFFENINYWLKYRGYFCFHVVDTKTLSLSSKTKMKDYYYLSHWNSNKHEFKESFLFSDKTKHIQNIHHYNIKPIAEYIVLARKYGFIFINKIQTSPGNYIIILKKKYDVNQI